MLILGERIFAPVCRQPWRPKTAPATTDLLVAGRGAYVGPRPLTVFRVMAHRW